MSAGGGESLELEILRLREWRDDAAVELRALEKRVGEMQAAVKRHERQLGSLARAQDIADAVAKTLGERETGRFRWWYFVAAIVALIPPYVTLFVVLTHLTG